MLKHEYIAVLFCLNPDFQDERMSRIFVPGSDCPAFYAAKRHGDTAWGVSPRFICKKRTK
ncbi:MAG: hypothetical protein B6245_16525 [Desulfobacteraceae bacterium 4572_88]|nr:MAG: hypothetical protein B6245_16525 [Desulfobacteraceae bacterium 4572_88]